ncbi:MAG TPA: MaoC family dehydratase [Microthrixaceae bacterium]|nr:MaoC family dehydratase [Microthrixaceae bacterium]HMX65861.1 MaoC family dehydratase [Microthrixaceae bacterium]HMY86152.1 MaoC family dehydratase [Microthrixaceae bacterium]HNA35996.1 MaoC family dehydratase [Microthrixaceae bacterium]HNJ70173.1 MaoC family dehydratase [Microthrixaceae bacterium]
MDAATKTNPGNFFEDFTLGQRIDHATPRTVTAGDRALYGALYPTRFALPSSDEFAAACGLSPAPVEELIGFHIAFGKTVPDISLNAVANLGYAECRFRRPVRPGDTLRSSSEVIGLKENSNGRTGVVWVRSTATDQHGRTAIDWARWVMVRKRDESAPAPEAVVPDLAPFVEPADLIVPDGLDLTAYDAVAAGSPFRFDDYEVGEKIDHVDGVTLSEAEHMMATRLWQNTAKVHFNTEARDDGRRLIYGGHVISMARALSFNGLANAQLIAAINAGAHTNPAFADDTVYAWSEVLDKAELDAPGVGALRLRLVATKGRDESMTLKGDDGKYLPHVLLDLDLWVLCPR